MAYSPIEQAYIDGIVSAQFPDPEPQPEPVMLADSGQVKSDAPGSIGPIKRNKAQEALGYVGELLTKAGVELDKVGLDVPVLGRITLKDLTVGESGKVLEDMSYGFMPVEGAGGFISGTTRIKPDAALELMNIAPTVGAMAKAGGKAMAKGAQSVLKPTIKTETKAFKNWFGDSKVVDDAGKPLAVYHGTNNDFTEFKPGFRGASENETSKIGFWFTDNPDTAASFAQRQSSEYITKTDPNTGEVMKWEDGQPKKFRAPDEVGQVMPVYLSMKNPLVFETKGKVDAFESFMDFRDQWAEYVNGTKGVEGAWRKKYVAINTEKTNKDFLNYLKENGHDGVILKNTEYDAPEGKTINQYMLTDPTAIKSAIGNKGTFDPKNPSMVHGAGAVGVGATQQEENK